MRRARKGDCLLLHYGPSDRPRLVLIDGGPKSVYLPHLKPRLKGIRGNRGIPDDKPLRVDLLMVSHVDDDHIQGILDLTRELREAVGAPLVEIRRFWHNSFDNIIGRDPKELTAGVVAQFGAASVEGDLATDADLDVGDDEEEQEVAEATLKVLASIKQGAQLRRDIAALGGQLNPETDGRLILASSEALSMPNGLQLTIAGPMQEELQKLQRKHDEWLQKLKDEGLKPGDVLSAYVDRSVPNLSSIVVLARFEDRTMLLTGDARGDKILEGLESVGLIDAGGSLHVEILKVPHHGSANNVELDFFERITADHYVFSGNGEHGNPEREAIEMVLDARGGDRFTLHLTYPLDEIDVARKDDWIKEQKKEKKRKADGRSRKEPREDWSHEEHSLKALFEQRPLGSGQKLKIVPEGGAHVIDLLDPVGF